MGLQSSGSISLSNIAGEFGGSAPHSLSEYYDAASGIPASGQISFSNFYGTSAITPVVFLNRTAYHISATYISNINTVVIAYQDVNSGYGHAIAGTVSGGTINFGSTPIPDRFNADHTDDIAITSDGNKAIITYRCGGQLRAVVGTVSGGRISFGYTRIFSTESGYYNNSTYDSIHNRVIVTYSDFYTRHLKVAVGTVSGTDINFGTTVDTFIKGSYPSPTCVSGNGQILIAYNTFGLSSNVGRTVVGNVSGNSISFLSPTTFVNKLAIFTEAIYDTFNQRVVIAYRTASSTGEAVVGSVSGGAGHFGSPVQFTSNNYPLSNIGMVYNSANNSVDILHTRGNNGLVVRGTVNKSNNSISFEPEFAITTGEAGYPSATFDSSSGKTVFAYFDQDNSSSGTALVI